MLIKGWYRFVGAAGTKMSIARVEPYYCGTDFSGWLSEGLEHPALGDGIVPRKVCFSNRPDGCKGSNSIFVKNCGSYYIYYLIEPPQCPMRYCGTD